MKKSFTLIELIVGLVIVSILIALALPTYMSVKSKAYRAEALNVLSEIQAYAWAYNQEHGGTQAHARWDLLDLESDKWLALGYRSIPNTDKWMFEIENVDTSSSECLTGGGCFNATATGIDSADGLHVTLLVNASGGVFTK